VGIRVTPLGLWVPPLLMAVLCVVSVFVATQSRMKSWLRWRLPGFREATLWQVASTMQIMLRSGCSLRETVDLLAQMERDTVAGVDLVEWRDRLATGHGDFASLATPTKQFPPLFVWLVASGKSDLAGGLKRAADIYRARAEYRTEVLLQAILPLSVLVLGFLIFTQVFTLIQAIISNFLAMVAW
jgi:type II secretory pathway component PulF